MIYLLLILPVLWGLVFWWGYRQGTEVVRKLTPHEISVRIQVQAEKFAAAMGKAGVAFQEAAEAFKRFFDAMPKLVDLMRASDGQVDTPKPEADLKP